MNVNSDEEYVISLVEYADHFASIGGWDECFDLLGEALRIDPNNVNALFVRHLVDVHFGSFNEANQCLDKILIQTPNDYNTNLAKAITLVNLHRYTEAVSWFNKAFKIKEPDIADDFVESKPTSNHDEQEHLKLQKETHQ